MVFVDIKKLNSLAKIPTRGSKYAAGYDLYAATDKEIEIPPHTTVKIDTGLAISLPKNTFAAFFPRSGIATKRGLRLANGVAVVDADYRGPCMVPLYNDSNVTQIVAPQERIAQMVVLPFFDVNFNEVEKLDETVRGDGGFGSTGTK